MTRERIGDLTERVLIGTVAVGGDPKEDGEFVCFVENEPGDFRMTVVTDKDGLPYEYELLVENGVALAIGEGEFPGYYAAKVVVKRRGEFCHASYLLREDQLEGIWLRLTRNHEALEVLRN
jgi:hypothetical protein